MDIASKKRKADPEHPANAAAKKNKGKKQWKDVADPRGIKPGDVGIWATCARNKEAPSVSDLRDLFEQYASKLYGDAAAAGTADDGDSDEDGGDIEADIQKELAGISKPATEPLFTNVKMDTACLIFFRTRSPVDPVKFVHTICEDAANGAKRQRCRFVKRLTPITATAKATENGIDELAKGVLPPHFQDPANAGKKFAIRITIRNNKKVKRDEVIKRVATAVGDDHKVDLTNPDLLILVEIYQNVCGMSVVGADFEKLKRYNLEEIFAVTEESEEKADAQSKEGPASRVPSERVQKE